MVLTTALHAPAWDSCPPVCMGAGCWNVVFGRQTQGEDCCGLWGDNLKEQEWVNLQLGMLVEETWTAIKVNHHCWVMCKGQGHHCSPFSHLPSPASPGTRKESHRGGHSYNPGSYRFLLHTPSQLWQALLWAQWQLPRPPHPISAEVGIPTTPAAAASPSAPCAHWGSSLVPLAATSTMPPSCQGRLLCSRAASGADPCVWPTHRDGAETTAEPQGLCN